MRNRLLFLTVVLALAFLMLWAYLTLTRSSDSQFVVQTIDDKGIFIGQKSKAMYRQEEHNKALKAVDEAWDNITLGETSAKVGRYEDAAMAFKRAYDIGGNSRALSGLRLAETYEKLGRYDDGINLLDNMIKNHELSAKGIQNANEIRSRLLAAKN